MHILVVEDETEMRERLRRGLEAQGYRVAEASAGDEALDRAAAGDHDLVVLDIMLPVMDGIEVLSRLRGSGMNVPVLLLTALDGVDDRVRGLDAGADDYLVKPFSMDELLARVRAVLRRNGDRGPLLAAGDVVLDPAARTVRRAGRPVDLTARELAILEFLLYNKGRALSRFSIAEHVWGDEFDPFSMSNFIDVHVKNLRRKLGPAARVIRTVRGIGYMADPGEAE